MRTPKLTATLASVLIVGGTATAATSGGSEHRRATEHAHSTTQRLDSRFAVGERFPDFALPSLEDGTPTRLSDFRGRKVMLHVFASW